MIEKIKEKLEMIVTVSKKKRDMIIISKEPMISKEGELKITEETYKLGGHLADLTTYEEQDEEEREEKYRKYETIFEEIIEIINKGNKEKGKYIINAGGKEKLIIEGEEIYKKMKKNVESIKPIEKKYFELRQRAITITTDNETLTGYQDFNEFKGDLTLIRKYLTTTKDRVKVLVGKRETSVQIRNIDLLTGGKDIIQGMEIKEKVKTVNEYVHKIKGIRIELTLKGGIPVTISTIAGETIQKA